MPTPFAPDLPPALLALADGTVFHGYSIGAEGMAVGEVVFNTAMTGYQEILTDPSYCRQLVTLTYPQIGNTGVNVEDDESERIQAEALIIKTLPVEASNWRRGVPAASHENSLTAYLKRGGRPGIAGIDTRKLTRLLRDGGAQNACLVAGPAAADVARALAEARAFPGLAGMDLAKVVSLTDARDWVEGTWSLGEGHATPAPASLVRKVVAFDYGVKRNILRLLVDRGCHVTLVPAQTPAAAVRALKPEGIFLANGPGDPQACDYAIDAVRELIEAGYPTFGICLGHQIMALASGAKTLKMKFGHHGANHPVKDLDDGKVYITSQNHGFAVDADTVGSNLRVTHRSLFDGSIQGLARTDRPAFCFQGHPEASPGPRDILYLFDRFTDLIDAHRKPGGRTDAQA